EVARAVLLQRRNVCQSSQNPVKAGRIGGPARTALAVPRTSGAIGLVAAFAAVELLQTPHDTCTNLLRRARKSPAHGDHRQPVRGGPLRGPVASHPLEAGQSAA